MVFVPLGYVIYGRYFSTKIICGKDCEKLSSLLLVHSAYDENGSLKLVRNGRDYEGGYVVPEKALRLADVLMGYGIKDDNSFEESFSNIYNKPSFGFDCGIECIKSDNRLFTLIRECIATDTRLMQKTSTKRVASFSQQLKKLDLYGKKVFIKMDIEGVEYEALKDIKKTYSYNITGITFELHLEEFKINKAIELLSDLNKDFVLLRVHGNNIEKRVFSVDGTTNIIPAFLELTYINKRLVKGFSVAQDQTHPDSLDMPDDPYKTDHVFTIVGSVSDQNHDLVS